MKFINEKSDMHTRHRFRLTKLVAPALTAALLFGASCTSGPQPVQSRYDFPAQSTATRTLDSWFDDAKAGVDYRAPLDQNAPVEQVFALAEVAYWDGDVERAGELYLRMLQREPAHALNRFAAARLYALRDEMVDFHGRVEPVLETIALGDVEPLTAVYLSLVGQQVRLHNWSTSREEAPFSADALGFPTRWMTTPVLSHWRLLDFDRDFGVEDDRQLADEYLSPYIAEDRPVNYERSKPYVASGVNLSPDFERSGVHYMETFATVEPSEGPNSGGESGGQPRSFWLYTNFSSAAKVWIDGEEVVTRSEGDYATGKRLRRVELSPGEHRILVKFAYQSGYRDWFDFALLADDATALGDSGLTFSEMPREGAAEGTIALTSDEKRPSDLEPLLVAPDQVDAASSTALFLTASAAYMDHQPEYFDAAFDELMERHEDFVPGYILRGKQAQTLWEVPSRIRDSRTLSDIRRANQLDPTNIDVAVRLIERLRAQGSSDREVRRLIEAAREQAIGDDGELRNVEPLMEWADWLSDQGWAEAAEKAWKVVVAADPTNCRGAGELQQLFYRRGHYPPLEEITAAHEECPSLAETLAFERDDLKDERLEIYRQRAERYPFSASAQESYADELVAQGRAGEAKTVLVEARDRMPWELGIWNELANQALAQDGEDAAAAILEEAIAQNGNAGWLQWRLAVLQNELPLREVMPDGLAAARAEIERAEAQGEGYASDEAYYVVDFAARQYFPDGSSVTLTHNLVRVLTKNAIDRFGEFSAPGDAQLVRARTIKADGSTRVPQETSGKSTLSLPGLAPGDFVEMAYVQYQPPEPISKTQRDGMRFFFRMGSISSLRSEYIVLGTDGEFERVNGAPEPEEIDTPLGKGVRFVRTDSPRPRQEPSTVAWEEFLPWIQLHRDGAQIDAFEATRRSFAEQIRDSSKISRQLDAQIAKWREGLEPGSAEEIEELFYRVSRWIPDPSVGSFGKDSSHALMERDGNPILLLKAAYDRAGVDSEIYLVKTKFQSPDEFATGEFGKYSAPLLKVQMPGGDSRWLSPAGPDAMYGAVGLGTIGQPAVCVSCVEPHRETVPAEGHRSATRTVDVSGDLAEDGTLTGEITITYDGIRAYAIRSRLRQRTDKSSRRKYVDLMVSSLLPGASLQGFEIVGEQTPDEPLVISATFEREQFARQTQPGTLQVERSLFREAVASSYAELSTRHTPLMVRYQRDHDYMFHVKLPDGYQAHMQGEDDRDVDSEWGSFSRAASLADGTLSVTSSIDLPIQRIQPADYKAFQQWATAVERSSFLFVTLEAN